MRLHPEGKLVGVDARGEFAVGGVAFEVRFVELLEE